METDWAVGQLMAALDEAGVADNTLVIFTSDNGCAPYIDIADLEAKGHFPSAQFRGYKFDIWDGGHRVPFMVRWPGKVKRAARCDQLTCLSDFMATCADILGVKLPDNVGEDSVSLLSALGGADNRPLHDTLVHHSTRGYFAIRQGRWTEKSPKVVQGLTGRERAMLYRRQKPQESFDASFVMVRRAVTVTAFRRPNLRSPYTTHLRTFARERFFVNH